MRRAPDPDRGMRYARWHVRQRLQERCRLNLSAESIDWLNGMIWAGHAEWVSDLIGMRQVYRFDWWTDAERPIGFLVVFDIRAGFCVTAFPGASVVSDGRILMVTPATATLGEMAEAHCLAARA